MTRASWVFALLLCACLQGAAFAGAADERVLFNGKIFTGEPQHPYAEAVAILQKKGNPIQPGDDFGGDEETILSNEFDRPVIVHRYPTALKAFYMQNDPEAPDLALCMDVLAPEGYGEIIGGGQRVHERDKLLARLNAHHLPEDAFKWYLDLRTFGSVPHAGFGMGIERAVAWICGIEHVRETIPFPRMLYKIYP